MKGLVEGIFGFVLGAITMLFLLGFSRMVIYEDGYQKGRVATLNKVVTLSGPEPCNIGISIGSLVEMIDAGILEWHKACIETVKEEKRNDN